MCRGYVNTSAVKSAISFIDGDKGILRYRGYPIEQLAERSNFTEVTNPPHASCTVGGISRDSDLQVIAAGFRQYLQPDGLMLARHPPLLPGQKPGLHLDEYCSA